ncbi:MAG: Crp/Fnr family transcriptional regulator [Marinobacter sp.]|uniref:Crp/Fnr family transcriptional regulator n=1 Tax=Marinobacter sp. TaxID=50741 RepID=UPI00299E80B5|nr:Crp/Fnr family transcriptional regulator [Marinobacter sp.]MDX1636171.1 Crp/Fnr family transcriptional regulator [Marinobacter sp.]
MRKDLNESCIIRHFQSYADLGAEDQRLLLSLEEGPLAYSRNTLLWRQGEVSDCFYTISTGWVCTYRELEDGGRQVLDIYVPGDVVGLREFAFQTRISSAMVLNDARLCAFPKSHLKEVFSSSLLLCNIFFMITARDQAILLERLVNLGRRSAREKLAHFLVEISQRLERTNAVVENHLQLPLTQELLADALGLSSVHVSRTFNEFRSEGLIETATADIQLKDIDGLKKVAGFDAFYLERSVNDLR